MSSWVHHSPMATATADFPEYTEMSLPAIPAHPRHSTGREPERVMALSKHYTQQTF